MVSNRESMRTNKLFYHVLPDIVVSTYVAKGNATGQLGYIAPLLRITKYNLIEATMVPHNTKITTVLPILDPSTLHANTLVYANCTRTMDICPLCTSTPLQKTTRIQMQTGSWTNSLLRLTRWFPTWTLGLVGTRRKEGELTGFFLTRNFCLNRYLEKMESKYPIYGTQYGVRRLVPWTYI